MKIMSLSPIITNDIDAETVIREIYDGTFIGCYLLYTTDHWRDILGIGCWVHDFRNPPPQNTKHLAFTTEEFKLTVEAVLKDQTKIKSLIEAKRMFGGEVTTNKM